MKRVAELLLVPFSVVAIAGCVSLPDQTGPVDPVWLVGDWRSTQVDGLFSGDVEYETLYFGRDGTFKETIRYSSDDSSYESPSASYLGKYRVDGSHILIDEHGDCPVSLPFYLENDTLVILRRAPRGKALVRVTLERQNTDGERET